MNDKTYEIVERIKKTKVVLDPANDYEECKVYALCTAEKKNG